MGNQTQSFPTFHFVMPDLYFPVLGKVRQALLKKISLTQGYFELVVIIMKRGNTPPQFGVQCEQVSHPDIDLFGYNPQIYLLF